MKYYTEKLKELREYNEYTQKEVAKAIGVGREQYRRYETGLNLLPITHLASLCKFYNVSADYILCISKEKRKLK